MKAKVLSVNRTADAAHAVLVTFNQAPTDEELAEAQAALEARHEPVSLKPAALTRDADVE